MTLVPGSRLGPYEILAPLGAGGMGEVYRALDTRLGREAALKVLPEALVADAERRERFDREARAVAALNHPNIVTIYGVEEIGPTAVLAMELVDGRSLSDSIPGGGMPIGRLLQLAIQLADAVSAAHSRGIIHRDLKPANIMVTSEGRVKVLDFGLARLRPEAEAADAATRMASSVVTAEGRILGTIAYMSPEQAEGKTVDHRSDIFSLGIVLYEMSTGQSPFTGDSSLAILSSIMKDTPSSVSDLNPALPLEVGRIVRRCLAKDPEQRYQSAKDVRNDLEQLKREVDSGEVATRTSGEHAQPVPAPRRPPRLVVLVGSIAAALLVVVLAAGWLVLARRPHPEKASQTSGSAGQTSKLDRTRVAVARFEDRTGDPSLGQFGAIAQDYLTNALGKVPGIEPAPAMSTATPGTDRAKTAATVDPVRVLAEQTGAATIVTGAYWVAGENLQVQARVVDARAGKVVAAIDAVAGPRSAPMVVLESVRQRVMGAVAAGSVLGGEPGYAGVEFRPPLYDAYREYVAGCELFVRDMAGAIRHFETAAQIDPDFFMPQLYAAMVHANRGERDAAAAIIERLYKNRDRFNSGERLWIDVLRAGLEGRSTDSLARLREAETLDPSDLRTKFMIAGNLYRMNRPGESAQVLKALYAVAAQNPASTRALGFTWLGPFTLEPAVYHMLGKHDDEFEAVRRGRAALPLDQSLRVGEARVLAALGRMQELDRFITDTLGLPGGGPMPGFVMHEAIAELRVHGRREQALALAEKAATWHRGRQAETAKDPGSRSALGSALYQAERWQEARAVFAKLASERPDTLAYQVALGTIAARLGDRTEAARVSRVLERVAGKYLAGTPTYNRACIAALLGNKEEAVALLQRAFAEGRACDVNVHHDMDVESLRDYPPFQELMKPKG